MGETLESISVPTSSTRRYVRSRVNNGGPREVLEISRTETSSSVTDEGDEEKTSTAYQYHEYNCACARMNGLCPAIKQKNWCFSGILKPGEYCDTCKPKCAGATHAAPPPPPAISMEDQFQENEGTAMEQLDSEFDSPEMQPLSPRD